MFYFSPRTMKEWMVMAAMILVFFVPVGYGLQYRLGFSQELAIPISLALSYLIQRLLTLVYRVLVSGSVARDEDNHDYRIRYRPFCKKYMWPKGPRCTKCGRNIDEVKDKWRHVEPP